MLLVLSKMASSSIGWISPIAEIAENKNSISKNSSISPTIFIENLLQETFVKNTFETTLQKPYKVQRNKMLK